MLPWRISDLSAPSEHMSILVSTVNVLYSSFDYRNSYLAYLTLLSPLLLYIACIVVNSVIVIFSVHSLATLSGTPLKSNAIQYSSSASNSIYSTFSGFVDVHKKANFFIIDVVVGGAVHDCSTQVFIIVDKISRTQVCQVMWPVSVNSSK